MSLLYIDSFDHYGTTTGFAKWDVSFPPSAGIVTTNPRTGIQSLQIIGAFGPQRFIGQKDTVIFGTALYLNILPTSNSGSFVKFQDLTFPVDQVKVDIAPDGSFRVFRNTTLIGQSAGGLVQAGIYTYIEVKAVISTTVGSVEIRVDGAVVFTLANANTSASGSAFVDGFQLMSFGGAGAWQHDDVYICDNLGGVNDDYLGAIRIYALLPDADSAPLQWTPSSGVTHFDLVDEVPPNTSDFVESNTIGQQDQYLYPIGAITPPVTVFGAQHSLYAGLDAAGARSIGSCVGGTVTGSTALSTSFRYVVTPYDINPDTGLPWGLNDFSTTPFGPAVTA